MPTIIFDKKQQEVPAGTKIKLATKKLGVPFSCENGECGTCLIRIEEGLENLSPLTQAEEDFGVEGDYRLACQASITKGKVIISY